ncbi:sulfite exporter TauE/SafE family protein [Microbulbifer sp. DLAB2-AF]|uniref:sulfite exporter TauE/SafE family protein n=1 Tax=Microbulbifer sp. DLAB2-AF TaxID=3243395 RepID=UPI00403A1B1E
MEMLLVYLLLGAVAGTAAGLLGIGGGLIIVPALVLIFSATGISPEVLTHMAVGTSLATIVITSISSVWAHNAKGAVDWHLFWIMTPGILVGSWLGGVTADLLPGAWLQLLIGVFAIIMAVRMGVSGLRAASQKESDDRLPGSLPLICSGGVIGWLAAIFGIGGGALIVPYLSHFAVKMQRAVGTSAAFGLPIAISGSLSFVVQGWGNKLLPHWSSGYIYWPAFLGIVLTSVLFAKFGANLAHRISARRLKLYFAILLCIIGIRFIWQNFNLLAGLS